MVVEAGRREMSFSLKEEDAWRSVVTCRSCDACQSPEERWWEVRCQEGPPSGRLVKGW